MPFVPVPKDLNKVQTKVAFNLTKRQIICFLSGAAVGVPTYLLTHKAIGNEAAVLLMIGLMLPFFFLAMYQKDGQPPEKVIRNFVRARFLYPQTRPYKTENIYAALEQQNRIEKEACHFENSTGSKKAARKQPARKGGRKRPARKRPEGMRRG